MRIVNLTRLSARIRKLPPIPVQPAEHLTPRLAAPPGQTIPPPIAAHLILPPDVIPVEVPVQILQGAEQTVPAESPRNRRPDNAQAAVRRQAAE